jgi:hypothetical protein
MPEWRKEMDQRADAQTGVGKTANVMRRTLSQPSRSTSPTVFTQLPTNTDFTIAALRRGSGKNLHKQPMG